MQIQSNYKKKSIYFYNLNVGLKITSTALRTCSWRPGGTVDGGKSSPFKKKNRNNNESLYIFGNFWNVWILVFHVTPSNFVCLVVKTSSPGPIVSVPTLGSWEYDDFIWKWLRKPSGGGIFSSVYGISFFQCLTRSFSWIIIQLLPGPPPKFRFYNVSGDSFLLFLKFPKILNNWKR